MSPVALTFDDGPHPQWTPAVLDALAEASVTATFFIQGDRLLARPGLARATVAEGHSVQAHCDRHRSHHQLSKAEITADLDRLLHAMRTAGLPRPSFWRPPYGDIAAPRSQEVAAGHGLRLVTWTVESCDWARDSAAAIFSELLAERRPATRLEPDSIILMHDSVGAHTAELVHLLAAEIRNRGWTCGPISRAARTPERPFNACQPSSGG
ncbi:MAG: polysaccharide deacetylase family protein [Solirubrobacterales bacterium]|nr:polysaccharide deacetylase family protein [Solirubrobacterales bacterium]MBV9716121.1 polysaccharide deacetylase family protein [Solirubrobacterales bacterium]